MTNNLKDAFVSVINKKSEVKNDYETRKQKHLEKSKALADNMVEHLSFLTEYGFKVYSQQYYEDCIPFHFAYEVVIKKPNGSHGAIIYPCSRNNVASSYQIVSEGVSGMEALGIHIFKTWDDLAKAIAYTLC